MKREVRLMATEADAYIKKKKKKIVLEAEKRGLRFSTQKTVCMHFCRLRRRHDEPILTLKNCAIPVVPEHKFLGLVFDRKLTWGHT